MCPLFILHGGDLYFKDWCEFFAHNNISNIQTKLQASAKKTTIWYESNSLQGNYGKYGSTMVDKIPWDTCVISLIFCVFKTEF